MWGAIAAAFSLALYFVPAPMPPAMPAMVQMAVNGDVKAPLARGARAGNRRPGPAAAAPAGPPPGASSAASDQHALDAAAVDPRNVVGHPGLAK